jgi:hypothetical protein
MFDAHYRDAVLNALPPSAAFRHHTSREGFESVFVRSTASGVGLTGCTTAFEAGETWAVGYTIALDAAWMTTRASAWSRSVRGTREVRIESAGSGRWLVDGVAVPELDGCFDVDLESSGCTNTIPVHRLGLEVGQRAEAPAVWIRADGSVERLEQDYQRIADDGSRMRYAYRAPANDFSCTIVFDASGLPVEYPEIASRVA